MFERLIIIFLSLILISIFYYFNFVDVIYDWNLKKFMKSLPTYFLPTFFISIIAIYIGIKNYLRKVGHHVSGYYTYSSSIYSKDVQISKITLINQKDKPLIINHIILKFGWNINLHIHDYEEKGVLIIKPYEQEKIYLDPILFYYISDVHVTNLDFVMKIKGKIILNTTEGNIKVKDFKNYYNPIFELLKNKNFILIKPFFSKNSNERSNIKFIIKYNRLDGTSSDYFILNRKDYIKIDDLKISYSEELTEIELRNIINKNIESNILNCKSYSIENIENKLNENLSRLNRSYKCSDETFLTFKEYFLSFLKSEIKHKYKSIKNKIKK